MKDEENLFSEDGNDFEEEDTSTELPITYTLNFPVTMGKEEITEIVLIRRPTWGAIDHLPVQGQKIGNWRPIVASMTKDLTAAQLKLLDASDGFALMAVVAPFVASSKVTDQD